jgi:glycosyltransferase involved in cell wall biosynthesis
MSLLFVSNVFPNPLNPTKGTFNAALLRELSTRQRVHVVSPVSWLESLTARVRRRTQLPQGSVTLQERLTVEFPEYYYPPKILRSSYGHFLEWSVGRKLDEAIRRDRPDAVVSYWAHPDGEVAVNAARRAGLPAITMVGGSDVLLLARQGGRREAILNVLHESDAVVTVNRDIATRLRQDGIPEEKLHVIYRGVDRTQFCPGDQAAARRRLGLPLDQKLMIAVGRMVPVKGFDLLVEACRRLRDRGQRFQCALLGGGELLSQLKKQVRDAGLEETVLLPGSQPHMALPDWYRAADLTALTSHSEGVPNVLLESICCGTPFVATRVGGVAEIADNRFHTLVPPNDVEALTAALGDRLQAVSAARFQPRWTPGTWKDSADRLCEVIEHCRSLRATPAWNSSNPGAVWNSLTGASRQFVDCS